MAFEIMFGIILIAVVLGFIGRVIYNTGFDAGRKYGSMEEAARWKNETEWKVEKAEKHV